MNRWTTMLCCVALLGACGSEGGDGATSTATDPSPSTAAVTTEGDGPGDDGVVVAIATNPCDLVTADEVAAATGLGVEAVVDQPPLGCVFDLGETAGVDIWVARDDGEGRLAGPASVYADYASRLDSPNTQVVDGVGEAAIFDRGYRALAVDAGGDRYLLVAVNGGYQELDEPLEALTTIARAAVERI